jgi:nitrite reductase/ring-hydroxylating ferredoxin subunit
MEADLQDGGNRPVTAAAGGALCPLADLAEGVPRGLTANSSEGPLEILVMRQGGRLVAYLNRCPHRGTPLDWAPDRFLAPDGAHFQCSTHGARFRIADGYCVAGPCQGEQLRPVRLRVEDGMVRLA